MMSEPDKTKNLSPTLETDNSEAIQDYLNWDDSVEEQACDENREEYTDDEIDEEDDEEGIAEILFHCSEPADDHSYFDDNGNLCVRNPSAFWIPELTIKEKISGTLYTVTGSYEGSDTFVKKLERISARKFINDEEGQT